MPNLSALKFTFSFLCCLWIVNDLMAQVMLTDWHFQPNDNPTYASPHFNHTSWPTIRANNIYENQGYDYNGYSWYRVTFNLPKSLRNHAYLKDSLRIYLAKIDDADQTYLNGRLIGKTGTFPDENGEGYEGFYDTEREYILAWDHPAIRWDAENLIAIRIYDGGGGGGLWGGVPQVGMVDLIDFVTLNKNVAGVEKTKTKQMRKALQLKNSSDVSIEGKLSLRMTDRHGRSVFSEGKNIVIPAGDETNTFFLFPPKENAKLIYTFTEKNTGKEITKTEHTPYILTPPESNEPKITNALVYGARPNKDFLWMVTSTGARPIKFVAKDLPQGLTLDTTTGIITGKVTKKGSHEVTFSATNQYGQSIKKVTIKIGDDILLTPPMGWNSWNAWGMYVSHQKVRQSADAMKRSGLVNHGWIYINIDDGWQGNRDSTGVLQPNEKFPNMKRLGDYLHGQGMKYGIYSSPGPESCGGLPGSLNHERQDVQTWAEWGIDYVKYDWCSYSAHLKSQGRDSEDWTVEEQVQPFRLIADAILEADRDMAFSVANWGMNNVWEWGDQTGGQLWRTTGDIEDNWASLKAIGFSQEIPGKFSGPGGWSDPDMLIVGWVGWGPNLHQTGLTPTEQYTHISLWALLSAPMLIGCDLSRIDDFTYNLLANDEVNAINQDPLGKAATIIYDQDDIQVWSKPLWDGTTAIGVFNLADEDRQLSIDWKTLGAENMNNVRDVWRQQDVKMTDGFEAEVFGHGVVLLVVK